MASLDVYVHSFNTSPLQSKVESDGRNLHTVEFEGVTIFFSSLEDMAEWAHNVMQQAHKLMEEK